MSELQIARLYPLISATLALVEAEFAYGGKIDDVVNDHRGRVKLIMSFAISYCRRRLFSSSSIVFKFSSCV